MNTHKIIKDGKTVFSGSVKNCFVFFLKQGQNIKHALKYGGYSIKRGKI